MLPLECPGRRDAAGALVQPFPRGQPYRFRMLTRPGQGRWHGLVLPVLAGLVIAASLIVRLSFDAGFGLALLGFGLLWTAGLAAVLRASLREYGRRRALLASSASVTGEVVAIVEDESRDDDGHTRVTYTPVVAFTPHGGPTVTGIPVAGRQAGARRGRPISAAATVSFLS